MTRRRPLTCTAAEYRAMATEAEMQATLTEEIDRLGGQWAHVTDSRGMPVDGLTDLIAAVPIDAVTAAVGLLELKTMTGRPRTSQLPWIDLVSRPQIVFVGGLVRPVETADAWGMDRVLALLRGEG